jgi:plasmid replication initiation protein
MRTELVVKDNALINASYNLDLVEQRLILLAIIEARESGKGINANDPLTVHAESYINQFNVHRNGAYKALKMLVMTFCKRNSVIKALAKREIFKTINHVG